MATSSIKPANVSTALEVGSLIELPNGEIALVTSINYTEGTIGSVVVYAPSVNSDWPIGRYSSKLRLDIVTKWFGEVSLTA